MLIALLVAAGELMAVLEFNNKRKGAVHDTIDRGYLADHVRAAALKALPGLRLMTRENIEVMAQANGVSLAECTEQCEVEIGRKLGADLVVSGDLLRVGSAFKLSLRMHDAHEARLLAAAEASGADADALVQSLDRAAQELLAPLQAKATTVASIST